MALISLLVNSLKSFNCFLPMINYKMNRKVLKLKKVVKAKNETNSLKSFNCFLPMINYKMNRKVLKLKKVVKAKNETYNLLSNKKCNIIKIYLKL